MEVISYLALGSNIEPREQYIRTALNHLREKVEIKTISPYYLTKPFGNTNQPGFINLVIETATDLTADELFAFVKNVEKATGRIERERWSEREIDIDILLYGNMVINTQTLKIPHPGLTERDFFLRPLLDIAPDAALPGSDILLSSYLTDALPVYVESVLPQKTGAISA